MGLPLSTFYRCLYVFSFPLFSNMSKTMFRSGHIQFCREFQALSFDNKKDLNCRDNRGDNLKILMGPFFLGHPLYVTNQIFLSLFNLFLRKRDI